jgi:hypothetical protein
MPEQEGKRPVGRPRQEPSTVINLRIPNSLLERFDKWIDAEVKGTNGKSLNRGTIIRQLIVGFLDEEGF